MFITIKFYFFEPFEKIERERERESKHCKDSTYIYCTNVK